MLWSIEKKWFKQNKKKKKEKEMKKKEKLKKKNYCWNAETVLDRRVETMSFALTKV